MLGDGADRVDVPLDITSNELAVATYAALQVDKVVGVADGADALGDLLALSSEALVLVASGFHVLRHLLQARCHLWGAARGAMGRRVMGVGEALVHPLERLFRLRGRFGRGPLFGGDPHCHVAGIGLLFPQLPPPLQATVIGKMPGSGWRGGSCVAILHDVERLMVWGLSSRQVADAVIEAQPHAQVHEPRVRERVRAIILRKSRGTSMCLLGHLFLPTATRCGLQSVPEIVSSCGEDVYDRTLRWDASVHFP